VTARAKGKVERPFRTVKEMHETLYHFHTPETKAEANAWLFQFLRRYNAMPHRTEAHSRMEDWVRHLPSAGVRAMCSWERFCTFAREPERRKVGVDARVTVEGVAYEVDPDLASETVLLWWGLFDQELYVVHGDRRYGPYQPVDGPIPLHRYRRFKTTKLQQRVDRLDALAAQLALPHSAVEDPAARFPWPAGLSAPVVIPFADPDPFHELAFPTVLAAKRAVADELAMPLAKLTPAEFEALNGLLARTLRKTEILAYVRTHLKPVYQGRHACCKR
jgi:hypothetical protein